MTIRRFELILAALLSTLSFVAMGGSLSGKAFYRERIALPPNAVFEAILEDVTLADRPAAVIGNARLDPAGNPPYQFTITYSPAKIKANRRYAVRARITLDGNLLFSTDQVYPVLQKKGQPAKLELLLRSAQSPQKQGRPADLLGSLPASFVGAVTAGDTPAAQWQLDLLGDGSFRSRLTQAAGKDIKPTVDIGRWKVNPTRSTLHLTGGQNGIQAFQIVDTNTLRKVDATGQPIDPKLGYELKRQPGAAPIDASFPLSGMYLHLADGSTFTLCATGQRLPLAAEGESAKLESAYLAARKAPEAALLVGIEGRIAERMPMEGKPRPMVVVERFVDVYPGRTCETRDTPDANLTETYWRLIQLNGAPVKASLGRPEPHLVLHGDKSSVSGSDGCNRIMGGFQLKGAQLSFGQLASTMMACIDGTDIAAAFGKTLEQTASWKVTANTLELADAAGKPTAKFEAVFLR